MPMQGFTNWLDRARAQDGPPRTRSARITVPGEDSTLVELWIALAIRVVLLVLWTAGAARATTVGARAFFVLGILLWGVLTIDTALSVRRRRTPPD